MTFVGGATPMANDVITESTNDRQLEHEFEKRFDCVPQNVYVQRFRTLLKASSLRFQAHNEGETVEPDETLFGEDIRQHRQRLLDGIAHSGDLPAMPKLVEKLDRVISDPDASMKDAAEVVALDPAIAARTLKLVNSPMYPLSREVERLDQALAFIGLRGVRHIVLTASVFGAFVTTESQWFSPRKFWEHSLAVAAGASLVARTLTEKSDTISIDTDMAFLAGLLHDVGKMLIAEQYWKKHVEMSDVAEQPNYSRMDAELNVFGLQHTDFGYAVLKHWGLPDCVCDAALSHHEPATTGTFVYVVHLADAIAHGLGFSAESDRFPKLDPRVWAELDLSDRVIEKIGYEVLIHVQEASSVLEN